MPRAAIHVGHIAQELEQFAPPRLAESWDNVGLLVGDRRAEVERVMTCLTITPASVAEAVRERVNLIVAHHPLPFKPLQRLTTDSTVGRMLLELCAARIAVYSPHTAFDSAAQGINRQFAEGLELQDIKPLLPKQDTTELASAEEDLSGATQPASVELLGAGRNGRLASPLALSEFAERVRNFLHLAEVRGVGSADQRVSRVAIACGSGGDFLGAARRRGCDCLVTGEANFHACLEAEATGVALILTGHFASERFAVERLADYLSAAFPTLQIWPSRDERDPILKLTANR
jgi:dinuclear metal center YbgI/SA1388 family protein